jgi:Phospholipase_D-nuclease N-terminal
MTIYNTITAAATAAAVQDHQQIWGPVVAAMLVIAMLAYVIFFLAALVSILGSRQSGGMKLVWIIFAFCAPFLGPVLWFLVGRKQHAFT